MHPEEAWAARNTAAWRGSLISSAVSEDVEPPSLGPANSKGRIDPLAVFFSLLGSKMLFSKFTPLPQPTEVGVEEQAEEGESDAAVDLQGEELHGSAHARSLELSGPAFQHRERRPDFRAPGAWTHRLDEPAAPTKKAPICAGPFERIDFGADEPHHPQ